MLQSRARVKIHKHSASEHSLLALFIHVHSQNLREQIIFREQVNHDALSSNLSMSGLIKKRALFSYLGFLCPNLSLMREERSVRKCFYPICTELQEIFQIYWVFALFSQQNTLDETSCCITNMTIII